IYNLNGIPNSEVRRDVNRAYRMFQYAATAFGSSDAQYNLARMFIEGEGVEKNPRQAIRWLFQAANKNHVESSALLGNMLFQGVPGVARQRARGLMYLILARDAAGPAASEKYKWVADLHDKAMVEASDTDKEFAHVELRNFLRRPKR
ncbi:MAG: sel1 repeat family protein, partial [Alphaproteobacteria bacterium]|nr:sel1 repeat family protein [Alphaproteobacteria bacterium]